MLTCSTACSKHEAWEELEIHTRFWQENLNRGDHVKELRVNRKVMGLKQVVGFKTGWLLWACLWKVVFHTSVGTSLTSCATVVFWKHPVSCSSLFTGYINTYSALKFGNLNYITSKCLLLLLAFFFICTQFKMEMEFGVPWDKYILLGMAYIEC